MRRTVLAALLVVALAGAAYVLRAQFMTRHRPNPPGSTTTVSFRVAAEGSPSEADGLARALVSPCVADVRAEVATALHRTGDDRFRLVLSPALDADSRRKLGGCLADIRVPHALARDVRLTNRGVSGG